MSAKSDMEIVGYSRNRSMGVSPAETEEVGCSGNQAGSGKPAALVTPTLTTFFKPISYIKSFFTKVLNL